MYRDVDLFYIIYRKGAVVNVQKSRSENLFLDLESIAGRTAAPHKIFACNFLDDRLSERRCFVF